MGVNELEKREKGTIFFGLLFLLLAIFMLFYVPNTWGQRYHAAKARLADKQQELQLAQLERVEEEDRVQSQEKMLAILNARDPRFELFSFINRVVDEADLSDRALVKNRDYNRRPRGISDRHPLVELELSGVSLDELIDLLFRIRSGNNLVAIYSMDVKPMLRDQGLDCDITFVGVVI